MAWRLGSSSRGLVLRSLKFLTRQPRLVNLVSSQSWQRRSLPLCKFIEQQNFQTFDSTQRAAFSTSCWLTSSSSGNDNDDNDHDDPKKGVSDQEVDRSDDLDETSVGTTTIVDLPPTSEGGPGVPATQTVPEIWPIVPIIAINKHPVFPKFIKIIEVSDERLMTILRRKVRLNQPYAGVFVKKDDDNLVEVVTNTDDIYHVGSFVQIVEMQDLGSRLRMVVMSHRRISFQGKVEEPADQPAEATTVVAGEDDIVVESPSTLQTRVDSAKVNVYSDPEALLMAETENVVHEPFQTSDEVKALTQEIIKTIRDIIVRISIIL
jgi:hypothetical protein